MHTLEHKRLEPCRIILLRPSPEGRLQFLLRVEEARYALPEVHIVDGQRATEQFAAWVRETLGMDAVSLSSVELPACPTRYEIMEPVDPASSTPCNHVWFPVDSLAAREFWDCNDFQAIVGAVAQSNPSTKDSRGRFARRGWFEDLRHWVQEAVEPIGLRLNGSFRQLNARPAFTLIRLETNGPAVWFKAVGEPNLKEYSVTVVLARLASPYLPSLIAVHREWNGWLAFEAEGSCLLDDPKPEAWFMAAHDLAELQIASFASGPELLDAGACDLSSSGLHNRVDPFFRAMESWMAQQIQASPAPLSHQELRDLCVQVLNAVDILDGVGSPSVLGHLDPNPGNLAVSTKGTVFLDWAEAFVGHPFLAYQYLAQHYRRACGKDPALETQLLACYLSPWRGLLSEATIQRALEVTPLAAVFAWTIASEPWSDPLKLNYPGTSRYLLGLMRRMHREARLLSERSVPCPD